MSSAPPQLNALLKNLERLGTGGMHELLDVAAHEVLGRSYKINKDKLPAAMGAPERNKAVQSCTFLIKQATRKGVKRKTLYNRLTPIGFGTEHLQILTDVLDWLDAGGPSKKKKALKVPSDGLVI